MKLQASLTLAGGETGKAESKGFVHGACGTPLDLLNLRIALVEPYMRRATYGTERCASPLARFVLEAAITLEEERVLQISVPPSHTIRWWRDRQWEIR